MSERIFLHTIFAYIQWALPLLKVNAYSFSVIYLSLSPLFVSHPSWNEDTDVFGEKTLRKVDNYVSDTYKSAEAGMKKEYTKYVDPVVDAVEDKIKSVEAGVKKGVKEYQKQNKKKNQARSDRVAVDPTHPSS